MLNICLTPRKSFIISIITLIIFAYILGLKIRDYTQDKESASVSLTSAFFLKKIRIIYKMKYLNFT